MTQDRIFDLAKNPFPIKRVNQDGDDAIPREIHEEKRQEAKEGRDRTYPHDPICN